MSGQGRKYEDPNKRYRLYEKEAEGTQFPKSRALTRTSVRIHPSRLGIAVLSLFGLLASTFTANAQDESDSTPAIRIMVHYMPWYQAKPYAGNWGWHWTMDHFNPDVVDDDDRRSIASHFYPLVGPYDSRDPDLLEYHTLLMKVAGIDGVIVDWYGTSSLFDYPLIHDATERLFEAVRTAGLSFAICYEDQTVSNLINYGSITPGQAIQHAQDDMTFVRDVWTSDPAYLRLDGAPVILNFGPQYFTSASAWQQIFSVFAEEPAFFTLDTRLDPVAAGAFAWPPMHMSSGGTLSRTVLDRYLNLFYAHGTLEWPSFVGGAFPGFHDIYAEAGGTSYGFLSAQNGQTFDRTLQRALDAGAPIVQIVTWNDFGEGTNVEPTREYGYDYLARIQETVQALRGLPFSRGDLEIPLQIFELRKRYEDDSPVTAALDEVAAHIIDGDAEAARSMLETLTDVDRDPPGLPSAKTGLQVFPNPASRAATIQISLTETARIDLAIYDALGRKLAVVAEGHHPAGTHEVLLDTATLVPGMYLIHLKTSSERLTRPMVVVN